MSRDKTARIADNALRVHVPQSSVIVRCPRCPRCPRSDVQGLIKALSDHLAPRTHAANVYDTVNRVLTAAWTTSSSSARPAPGLSCPRCPTWRSRRRRSSRRTTWSRPWSRATGRSCAFHLGRLRPPIGTRTTDTATSARRPSLPTPEHSCHPLCCRCCPPRARSADTARDCASVGLGWGARPGNWGGVYRVITRRACTNNQRGVRVMPVFGSNLQEPLSDACRPQRRRRLTPLTLDRSVHR